jgi:hypothetical protein
MYAVAPMGVCANAALDIRCALRSSVAALNVAGLPPWSVVTHS